jgi:hypothetical protein
VTGHASRKGLLYGAASTVLLVVAGVWWALGSFGTSCPTMTFQAPDGTITTSTGCSPDPSNLDRHGLVGVWWFALPAVVALAALALTPVPRVRAPARLLVGVAVLVLGLLAVFTPFVLLLLPAGVVMLLAAVYAEVRPTPPLTGLAHSL